MQIEHISLSYSFYDADWLILLKNIYISPPILFYLHSSSTVFSNYHSTHMLTSLRAIFLFKKLFTPLYPAKKLFFSSWNPLRASYLTSPSKFYGNWHRDMRLKGWVNKNKSEPDFIKYVYKPIVKIKLPHGKLILSNLSIFLLFGYCLILMNQIICLECYWFNINEKVFLRIRRI